ncbi:cell division topological specificity factor MinE [Halothermothrix orenii]|uniref:Cell division topological specificity factor n=1 Tax=Halothermothrix orenii (strain H 168 / OCM 544 / DSM 9562) TaxID=373903 RepID=B8CXZ8_HALOH|nr:cell division topological specificity factor MinE [Halothermothrix orenii]ACL70167.1 cell division topological specificity factor MinE [Halothermothrix orenii H 168]
MGLKEGEGPSKDIAKERLQFILIQDRIDLSPQELESMKKELMGVITKYIKVDSNNVKMKINRNKDMMALVANFPLEKTV